LVNELSTDLRVATDICLLSEEEARESNFVDYEQCRPIVYNN
jgi:hypothetical protein